MTGPSYFPSSSFSVSDRGGCMTIVASVSEGSVISVVTPSSGRDRMGLLTPAMTVDWGDETVDEYLDVIGVSGSCPTHTYSRRATVTIRIYTDGLTRFGVGEGIQFGDNGESTDDLDSIIGSYFYDEPDFGHSWDMQREVVYGWLGSALRNSVEDGSSETDLLRHMCPVWIGEGVTVSYVKLPPSVSYIGPMSIAGLGVPAPGLVLPGPGPVIGGYSFIGSDMSGLVLPPAAFSSVNADGIPAYPFIAPRSSGGYNGITVLWNSSNVGRYAPQNPFDLDMVFFGHTEISVDLTEDSYDADGNFCPGDIVTSLYQGVWGMEGPGEPFGDLGAPSLVLRGTAVAPQRWRPD